ncbi:hypothetical protein J7E25_06020 [Agromyces sp. ISL-38]|uniref:DUF6121 family protein n=1 Tax=Agromyces sp. ISL-38 TaxID=2819107 RepID=UPI001BE70814|nr:DUF6121 family protein [Agromyces sp. ISL-38]MBT2498646.1 hypothetical protein [Agromyces sp. ISL-38]MBT2518513.1 hypothetical protein [Streptomyces sp. ISL-90]
MEESRRRAWVVAAFAAALYLALVVCAYGFGSLLTDAEVIPSGAAGPFVGPAAVGASVAALLLSLARGLRTPSAMLTTVLLAALWTWLSAVVVATIGYAIVTGTVLASLIFGLGFGVSLFGLLIPACAALVALLAFLVAQAQSGGARRPRWPWERDEEE